MRHAVIWRKLSFGTQSANRSRFVETMLTVIETCRQQHRNTFDFLTTAIQNYLAGQPAPSLLPGAQSIVFWQPAWLDGKLRHAGKGNDIGWSARHDVMAAVAFLQRECPQQSVFIVGRSLGAAAAIFAAQELGSKVAGYFLEQPYKDLQSAVWNRLQNHLPPVLDWAAYLGLRLWSPVFLPIDPNRISPIEQIAKILEDVPVMIVTGSADQHAHLSDVKELFSQVEWHAQLIVFDGAAHEPLDWYDPQLYESTLLRFLKRQNPRTVIGVGSSTGGELERYLSEMPQ
ncbi:MAG: alpha/beta hydrolase family protein [Pirellulaceae bacterium]